MYTYDSNLALGIQEKAETENLSSISLIKTWIHLKQTRTKQNWESLKHKMYSPVIRKYWSNRPTFTDCRSLSFSTKQQERWKELFSQSEFSLFQKSVKEVYMNKRSKQKDCSVHKHNFYITISHLKNKIKKKLGTVAKNFSSKIQAIFIKSILKKYLSCA